MATHNSHRRQKLAAVIPLIVVIIAALIWSGYATYHHAEGPAVPGFVAWTLIAALDGTVVVTTPVWLSTVLPARVRNYAAVICMGALVGSMFINYAETGWIGVFPPLIAGALIHLVGVVLRAFARLDVPSAPSEDSVLVDSSDAGEEHLMPSTSTLPDLSTQATPPSPKKPDLVVPPLLSLRKGAGDKSAYEIVSHALTAAHASGADEPSGADLTRVVREAGHAVNDNYGRSAKARWKNKREQVSA